MQDAICTTLSSMAKNSRPTMVHHVAQAFVVVLLALIAIKVAASLVTISIAPIAALLGLVLLAMWLFERSGIVK